MFRRFSIDFAIFAMFLDAVLIALSLAVATFIRPALSSLPFVDQIPPLLKTPFILYPIFPLLWVIVLLLFSAYDRRRNLLVGDELANLTAGSLLVAVSLAGILYLSFRDVSRVLFLVFFALAYLLLLSWRLVYRFAFQQLSHGEFSLPAQARLVRNSPNASGSIKTWDLCLSASWMTIHPNKAIPQRSWVRLIKCGKW
jgi:FlaA1/EpsC-like NDP-sugar epimerase